MSLVRKRALSAGGALLAYHPYAKRARTAYTIANMAYRNRKGIKRAATRIARSYRRYKKRKRSTFSRKNIGEPVGTGVSKRSITTELPFGFANTRQLYSFSLLDIPEGSAVNQRERRIANIRGVKICSEINVANTTPNPLYVNVAVLSPKGGNVGVDKPDFFRSNGNERAVDFGNALDGNQFHCLPINADKFTILRHKRYKLAVVTGPYATGTNRSYMNLDWWIPVKRQVRYDAATGSPEHGQMYLCVWMDTFGRPAGSGSELNAAGMGVRAITYFKEPKN